MDITKACDSLMCVHIKRGWQDWHVRPRTSVFIAELKKNQPIQAGRVHVQQVQQDSDGQSTNGRDLLPRS